VAVSAAARFDRMVPAAPDAIGALRRELRRWSRRQGAAPPVQANVALAFSEACTMIIGPDGPREEPPGPLMVQASVHADELRLRVSHRSSGVPSPPVGVGYGFGLALMARICDRFEVRRRREGRPGTALLMAFSLERPPAPARSSLRPPSRSTPRR
jgi:anti-sigma regulatory factor (Ser/Thr protein kinase)